MVSKTFEMPIFEDCCPTIVESQSGTCAIKAAFALAFATSSARGSGEVSSFVSVAYANTVLVFETKSKFLYCTDFEFENFFGIVFKNHSEFMATPVMPESEQIEGASIKGWAESDT